MMHFVRSCPARPTKGLRCSSSVFPGASPINSTVQSGSPSPNTRVVSSGNLAASISCSSSFNALFLSMSSIVSRAFFVILVHMQRMNDGLRTWIEIDRKAVARNVKTFRSLLSKKTKLFAVTKSNAYGHSLIDFAREMEKNKVDWVVEGIALRKVGVKLPILVLGYTLPERLPDAREHALSVSVSTFDALDALIKQKGKHPKFHLKVDTGMHRQGFQLDELSRVLNLLQVTHSNLQVSLEGLFTHFAAAKNTSFPAYTQQQLMQFNVWRDIFLKAGFTFISHAAATSGTLLFPESHFDLVRVGIGLYGYWP